MKEHHIVIKEQNPQELTTIVSKVWKDVSEEEKEKENAPPIIIVNFTNIKKNFFGFNKKLI
jgi:hypothetical protein